VCQNGEVKLFLPWCDVAKALEKQGVCDQVYKLSIQQISRMDCFRSEMANIIIQKEQVLGFSSSHELKAVLNQIISSVTVALTI
jgi:hypothetical protein